jgi:hypothetical protein
MFSATASNLERLTSRRPAGLPAELPGTTLVRQWPVVVAHIDEERGGRPAPEVVTDVCAPLPAALDASLAAHLGAQGCGGRP